VFGSVGIATAPLLAWVVISNGLSWRHYYWLLAVPGAALAAAFVLYNRRNGKPAPAVVSPAAARADDRADWPSLVGLLTVGVLQGMVYAGALSFLVRYLSGIDVAGALAADNMDRAAFWTAGVLLVGCIGQYAAGAMARPDRLERQLTAVTLLNVPCLAAMALAEGYHRVAAAAVFALFHFMYQPIYNSLVSKYTSRRRRSLGYGLSFTMTFGLGGFGAALAGYLAADWQKYGALAALSAAATVCGVGLWWKNAGGNRKLQIAN
jgi:predicted MFS family arabinose efflux permease